jgi:hypothetical protein
MAPNAMPETCPHPGFAQLVIVPMDVEMPGYTELAIVKRRGMPFWWLGMGECPLCQQRWLIAQEERLNDIVVMRRLSDDEAARIVGEDVWPSDFDRYETLLRIGAKQDRRFRHLHPVEQLSNIVDLARERPGISVEDLAWLLNIELPIALELAKYAVHESEVSITLTKGRWWQRRS